jgi:hypothetical protein
VGKLEAPKLGNRMAATMGQFYVGDLARSTVVAIDSDENAA